MASKFDELERGGAVLYGDSYGIWVMILFGKPTKADMLLARPALAGMSARSPAGFPTLTWVLREAGLSMEDDARTAAAEVTNEFSKKIVAQATLIEISGFQGATVRAIVAGLDMMSRSASSKKVFGELTPAIDWCARRATDQTILGSAESVIRALEATRATLVRDTR